MSVEEESTSPLVENESLLHSVGRETRVLMVNKIVYGD